MSTLSIERTEPAVSPVKRSLMALRDRYRANARRRQALRELRCLSHATLKDIALDRSEALSVVYGSVGERRRGYNQAGER